MLKQKNILIKTGYFSLISGYKDIFKNPTTKKFYDGTTFEDIYKLYRFDHDLRGVFLKYILLAEHSVKTSLAYNFSSVYGEKQQEYIQYKHYNITHKNRRDIQKLTQILLYQLTHNTDYPQIEHYKSKYNNVPLWVMIHVLTLGQFSHMFDYLNATVPIKVCSDYYQISRKDIHSFLSVMTKHRNVCAHGDRFFNYHTKDSIRDTIIHKKMNIVMKNGRYIYGKNDIFSEVIILKYLLDKEDFHEFYYELKNCIKKYSPTEMVMESMGFPTDWMKIIRLKP